MTAKHILSLTAARRHSTTGSGRDIRQRAGLSLQEVADAVGVALATMSRWETGQRQPRGEPAIRWAETLAALENELASVA